MNFLAHFKLIPRPLGDIRFVDHARCGGIYIREVIYYIYYLCWSNGRTMNDGRHDYPFFGLIYILPHLGCAAQYKIYYMVVKRPQNCGIIWSFVRQSTNDDRKRAPSQRKIDCSGCVGRTDGTWNDVCGVYFFLLYKTRHRGGFLNTNLLIILYVCPSSCWAR